MTRPDKVTYYVFWTLCHLVESSSIPSISSTKIPVVNGFVHLAFHPLPLLVDHGGRAVGLVNSSVLPAADLNLSSHYLHVSCLDTSIASLEPSGSGQIIVPLHADTWTLFNVTVYGKRLGITKLQFHFRTNVSIGAANAPKSVVVPATVSSDKLSAPAKHAQPPEVTQESLKTSLPSHGDGGSDIVEHSWIPTEYEIVVRSTDRWVKTCLDYVVIALMALNIIGIGGQVNPDEVLFLVKRPLALSAGLLCRFGVMPAVS